jgi:hypothetical protein
MVLRRDRAQSTARAQNTVGPAAVERAGKGTARDADGAPLAVVVPGPGLRSQGMVQECTALAMFSP